MASDRGVEPELSRLELNRTLLHRQGLIERSKTSAASMVERLAGMQAQVPNDPYLALWSRIEGFDPAELSGLVATKRAIRSSAMRCTVHLITAVQAPTVLPLTAPVLAGTFRSQFLKQLNGQDPRPIIAAGRGLLGKSPMTRGQIGKELASDWPDIPAAVLGHTVAFHLPLMQMPPRGEWKASHQATLGLVEREAGITLDPDPPIDDLVLAYLAAFGPASPADLRNWSRITGLKSSIDRLRPDLRKYADESGRELLDLPDGQIIDPGTPVPPRFLPEYDNVLLGHEDRSRMLAGLGPGMEAAQTGRWIGSLLVDGYFRAFWKLEEDESPVELRIFGFKPDRADPKGTKKAVTEEGLKLAEVIAPGSTSPVVEFV